MASQNNQRECMNIVLNVKKKKHTNALFILQKQKQKNKEYNELE
jgi:hypothetical protein